MQCYALAAGGEAALVRMLELLEDEVSAASVCSASLVRQARRSCLQAAPPTKPPHALSAFPLLEIEKYRY